MNFFKKLFCKHKNSEVICWHWTHGPNMNEPRFLEIQLKCNNCGKYYFTTIRECMDCNEFISIYKDKQWSTTCRPVL